MLNSYHLVKIHSGYNKEEVVRHLKNYIAGVGLSREKGKEEKKKEKERIPLR